MSIKVKTIDDICIQDISSKNEYDKDIDVTMQKRKINWKK